MSGNDVTLKESVGNGGTNLQQDKIPVKVLLNKFITARKLWGVAVLSLAGGDGVSEPALNNAIRKFQENYVPIKHPDGRIDKKGSKTLAYLNKEPSQVKLQPRAVEAVSYLKGAVGKRDGSVHPPNRAADVKWVQERLNVQIHFGKVPAPYTRGRFVPTSGRIKPHKPDDPTMTAITYVQSRVLNYGRATGVIEPGDRFDLWLQEIHFPDPDRLLESLLTNNQKVDRRVHDAMHSEYFQTSHHRYDQLIFEVANKLLRKDCDDAYLDRTEIERYANSRNNTPLRPASLKGFLYMSNVVARESTQVKKGGALWVNFLRDHLAEELIEGPKKANMAARTEAMAEMRGKVGMINGWWKEQSKKPNSIISAPRVRWTLVEDDAE